MSVADSSAENGMPVSATWKALHTRRANPFTLQAFEKIEPLDGYHKQPLDELLTERQDNFLDRLQGNTGRMWERNKRWVFLGLSLLVLVGLHAFAVYATVLTGWKKTRVWRHMNAWRCCLAGPHHTHVIRLDHISVLFRVETTLWTTVRVSSVGADVGAYWPILCEQLLGDIVSWWFSVCHHTWL